MISHLARRADFECAHRFSFFAFEAAMLITCGTGRLQRVVVFVRLWGWMAALTAVKRKQRC